MQATRSLTEAFSLQLRQRLDMGLFLVIAALLGLGVVMVASASIGDAGSRIGGEFYLMTKQIIFVAIGLIAGYVMYQMPLRFWETSGLVLLALAFVLLIAVLIPGIGKEVNGAKRWINLPLVDLQVSEVVKLLMVLYIAGYVVRHGESVKENFAGFVKPLALVVGISVLLLLEPDFGAAAVITMVTLGVLFLGGVRISQFLGVFSLAVAMLTLLAVATPYRLRRLTSFLDPWKDAQDSGFQLVNSLIAIGSGSWTGVGLGASVQKLSYLPEAHNDFMFAILAEELGLVGVLVVLILFSYAVSRAFAIGAAAQRANHFYGAYVAYGIALWIGIQAFVNIGVNMGVLPTKGLTLPFMSAGGSSLVTMCAAVGLLLRVHREVHDLNIRGLRTPAVSTAKRGRAA